MTEALNAKQIRERITAGYDPESETADEWDEVLDEMNDKLGEHPLIAFTHALEDHDRYAVFDATQFEERFGDTYREYWDTPGKFVQQRTEDYINTEEAQTLFEELSRWVNWDEYAKAPDWSDYTMITLDPEDSRGVHVFQLEA